MHKKILLLLNSIALALVLIGCGPTNSNTNPTPTAPAKSASNPAQPGEAGQTTQPDQQNNPSPATPTPSEPNPASPKKLKLHFLDVGQADCILLQTPDGKNLLIDAGNNSDSATILAYLRGQGIQRLDIVVGTHPHEDHLGSLDTIINNFKVGQVVMPKVTTTTETFRSVLLAIKAKGLKITTAQAGLKLDLGPQLTASLLAPNSASYQDLNNYSAVLKVTYGQTSFLFTGDAEELAEQEMLASGQDLRADLLKVGHHGSKSSTGKKFLKAVQPKYAIITVGTDNKYDHPARATLSRLSAAGVTVYRTDTNGTLLVESDGTSLTFTR